MVMLKSFLEFVTEWRGWGQFGIGDATPTRIWIILVKAISHDVKAKPISSTSSSSISQLCNGSGWAQVSLSMILALLDDGHEAVYAAIERHLLFAQTAAIMEILHSILGLVRSPVSSTLPQITGRLFITWGILWSFPETHSHILVTPLIISWSITESITSWKIYYNSLQVIRYSFFGIKESFGFTPSWLLWLRYSTFIVCYPVGMVSEVGLIYIAFPFMKASEKYCIGMPNKWNFSFDYFYFSTFLMALYVPVFPYLLRHMVAQRKKALSKAKTT
uniref:Very-long-chain (3R)-3-hydroxyacyl-CoA dehydratase n=1 Tax=Oryza glumipatula TaxID=40148 RepID=A0A0D9Y3A4_9ORYZ